MAQPRGESATIYSVAEMAGVSIASVSRVMQGSAAVSDKTRQKVLQAVDVLDYVPLGAARSLAVRHHEAHGLVLPELVGPYYAELLMGFESRAAELGQSVILLLAGRKTDLPQAVRRLAIRVDGVAVLGSVAISDAVVTALHSKRPVVVIAGDSLPGIDAVGSENVRGAAELATHLMAHGRRRLLFVGDPAAAPDVRDRYRGFVAAHGDHPLLEMAQPVRIPFHEAAGARFAERLLAGEYDTDALVCANDQLALSIMDRLQSGGCRVPDDIAVVGWDDVMAARYIRPGLTTVRQPVRELGEIAAERLHERVNGAACAENTRVLATTVILRSSCGCPHPARRHTDPHRSTRSDPPLHRKRDQQ